MAINICVYMFPLNSIQLHFHWRAGVCALTRVCDETLSGNKSSDLVAIAEKVLHNKAQ